MKALSIHGLDVGYGGAPVLSGVAVAPLAPGTLAALIGPNAAGKSTLMRAVAGLVRPSAGRIALGGEDLVSMRLPERARRVRLVPQAFATQARLNVFDLVLLARMAAGQGRATQEDLRAAERALHRVGIEPLADRLVCHLSGGQQQLAALAQALARPAPVFLLDEPTSALDLKHQLEAIAIMRKVAEEDGAIVIAALHDLNLAARHASHVVLMGAGRVLMEGAARDVLADRRCAEAYGVNLATQVNERGSLMVEAFL